MTDTKITALTTQQVAANLLERDIVILDTETGGLKEHDEVIEIGVINTKGEILINCLVEPTRPIPQEATDINGITNQMVIDNGKSWPQVLELLEGCKGSTWLMYNASFDVAMLEQSETYHKWARGSDHPGSRVEFVGMNSLDLMELANRHFHKHLTWCKDRSQFKRLSLKACCELAGIPYPDNAHRAITDCLLTLELLRFMANDVTAYEVFTSEIVKSFADRYQVTQAELLKDPAPVSD